jgi:hypothetical protein
MSGDPGRASAAVGAMTFSSLAHNMARGPVDASRRIQVVPPKSTPWVSTVPAVRPGAVW